MTQPNLLELAKQGDPQAIATLMNRSLEPKGMTASVDRDDNRLQVRLEAEQAPNRQVLTAFVQNGIKNLGLTSIHSIDIVAYQAGVELPIWTQYLDLTQSDDGPPAIPPPRPPVTDMPVDVKLAIPGFDEPTVDAPDVPVDTQPEGIAAPPDVPSLDLPMSGTTEVQEVTIVDELVDYDDQPLQPDESDLTEEAIAAQLEDDEWIELPPNDEPLPEYRPVESLDLPDTTPLDSDELTGEAAPPIPPTTRESIEAELIKPPTAAPSDWELASEPTTLDDDQPDELPLSQEPIVSPNYDIPASTTTPLTEADLTEADLADAPNEVEATSTPVREDLITEDVIIESEEIVYEETTINADPAITADEPDTLDSGHTLIDEPATPESNTVSVDFFDLDEPSLSHDREPLDDREPSDYSDSDYSDSHYSNSDGAIVPVGGTATGAAIFPEEWAESSLEETYTDDDLHSRRRRVPLGLISALLVLGGWIGLLIGLPLWAELTQPNQTPEAPASPASTAPPAGSSASLTVALHRASDRSPT